MTLQQARVLSWVAGHALDTIFHGLSFRRTKQGGCRVTGRAICRAEHLPAPRFHACGLEFWKALLMGLETCAGSWQRWITDLQVCSPEIELSLFLCCTSVLFLQAHQTPLRPPPPTRKQCQGWVLPTGHHGAVGGRDALELRRREFPEDEDGSDGPTSVPETDPPPHTFPPLWLFPPVPFLLAFWADLPDLSATPA